MSNFKTGRDEKRLSLRTRVVPLEANDRDDINSVRDVLQELGEYKGRPASHYEGFMMDSPMRSSIENFQKKNGLEVDGRILPGGETEAALNRRLFENKRQSAGALRENSTDVPELKGRSGGKMTPFSETKRMTPLRYDFSARPGAEGTERLYFNGKQLTYEKDGSARLFWHAESGRRGYQSKQYQHTPYVGPIPEGRYEVRQDRFQSFDEKPKQFRGIEDVKQHPLAKAILGWAGGGSWKGGRDSWGNHRIWLEPSASNNMGERGNMAIHGGTTPGSGGCVDLGNEMDDFAQWYKKHGKNISLDVQYEE